MEQVCSVWSWLVWSWFVWSWFVSFGAGLFGADLFGAGWLGIRNKIADALSRILICGGHTFVSYAAIWNVVRNFFHHLFNII